MDRLSINYCVTKNGWKSRLDDWVPIYRAIERIRNALVIWTESPEAVPVTTEIRIKQQQNPNSLLSILHNNDMPLCELIIRENMNKRSAYNSMVCSSFNRISWFKNLSRTPYFESNHFYSTQTICCRKSDALIEKLFFKYCLSERGISDCLARVAQVNPGLSFHVNTARVWEKRASVTTILAFLTTRCRGNVQDVGFSVTEFVGLF